MFLCNSYNIYYLFFFSKFYYPFFYVYFSSKEMVVKGIPDGTQILARSVPGAYAGMLVKVFKELPSEGSNQISE